MTVLGQVPAAALEDWFRVRYFDARVDISSSGVHPYTLGQVRGLTGLAAEELDDLVFRDSPSSGQDRLRTALIERFEPGPSHEPLVCNGSTEAILLAVSALVGAGDEVVVTTPSYHALTALAASAGATLVRWELDLTGGRPDLEALRSLIGPRTRAVIVNFPHNPSGITLTAPEYDELLAIVDHSNAYLLWDAAFAELVHEAEPLPDPSRTIERCVSFGTLSKAYGLPGLRVGWCIAPSTLAPELVRMRDYVTLNTSPLLEEIAARVIENADAVLGPRLAEVRGNRANVADWLAANGDIVAGVAPGGGVTFFPQVLGLEDTRPLCEVLADEHSVLTVPGECFDHPDRVRLGFGAPGPDVAAGLDVFARVVRQWSRR
ncbi:capreomycidine synthase [Nocardioides sp. InS609-2]|uniref:capreomycidine synthase n=1 Tax=Nocardioides sp. InS609-2 TaxID=2760705 RepID=UPI0020C0775E|nr:capreomycidine synthase [Nocardioides sp. InS609-2]